MGDDDNSDMSDPVPVPFGPPTLIEFLESLFTARGIYRSNEKIPIRKAFSTECGTPYGFKFADMLAPTLDANIFADIDNRNCELAQFLFEDSSHFHHIEIRSNIFYGGTHDLPKESFESCNFCHQMFNVGDIFSLDLHHQEVAWHSKCLQKFLSGIWQTQDCTKPVKCGQCEKFLLMTCTLCGADIPVRELVLDLGEKPGRNVCTHCLVVRTACGYDLQSLDFVMTDAVIKFPGEADIRFDRPDLVALWPAFKSVLAIKLALYRARWYITKFCYCPRLEMLLKGILRQLFKY